MKRLALAATVAVAVLAANPATLRAVSLQDTFTLRMEEGLRAYEDGDFATALLAFQDARLLRPSSVEARMNLALALAREGDIEASRALFREIARSASAADVRRAEAFYNLGTASLAEAEALFRDEEVELEDVIPPLLESIGDFNRALEIDPNYAEARFNRAQAQHLLQQIAELIPPPMEQENEPEADPDSEQEQEEEDQQQEDSQDQEEGDDEQDESSPDSGEEGDDPGQQDSSPNGDSDAEEQEQPQGQVPPDSDAQDDQSDPEQDESGQDDGDPSRDQGESGIDESPVDVDLSDAMSEEEANALLNLLGDDNLLPLGRASRSSLERDW